MTANRARAGFTLAEVAVTLVIVAIGLTLVLQGLNTSKMSAAQTHNRKVARELALLTLGEIEAGLYWEDLNSSSDILAGTYAEAGYEDEPPDERCGDVPSPATGAAELRSAGFRDVTAAEAELRHTFTVETYIGFLTEFDEETLFEEMARSERHRFLARLRERLMGLTTDELTFVAPIVYVVGHRGP